MSGGLNIAAGNQEERWIRFQGGVTIKSASALMRILDDCYRASAKVNLMITSLGGDIFQGQTIFSHLQQLPLKIATYNISTVQSVAVPLFCAGSERYCLPEATFMIHAVNLQMNQPFALTIQQLRENADRCESSTKAIATMIASTTGQNEATVFADMNQTKYFNAEQSISYGLVHKVVTNLFPAGTGYTVIEEDGTVRVVDPTPRIDPSIDALLTGKMFPNLSAMPSIQPGK
jgi:ATP-dependent Clp protease, protease subunit